MSQRHVPNTVVFKQLASLRKLEELAMKFEQAMLGTMLGCIACAEETSVSTTHDAIIGLQQNKRSQLFQRSRLNISAVCILFPYRKTAFVYYPCEVLLHFC